MSSGLIRTLLLGDVGVDVVVRSSAAIGVILTFRAWRPSSTTGVFGPGRGLVAAQRRWPRPSYALSALFSGSTLRSAQHRSGSRSYSCGPYSRVLLGDRLRGVSGDQR